MNEKKTYHKDNKSFMLYKDWEEFIDLLTDEAAGALLRALFAYAKRGEVPDFRGELLMLFMMMSNQLERDGKKWEERCEKNAENIRKRWEKEAEQ